MIADMSRRNPTEIIENNFVPGEIVLKTGNVQNAIQLILALQSTVEGVGFSQEILAIWHIRSLKHNQLTFGLNDSSTSANWNRPSSHTRTSAVLGHCLSITVLASATPL